VLTSSAQCENMHICIYYLIFSYMNAKLKRKVISELRRKIGRNREASQLTQAEVAFHTGVHQSQISRFMAGNFTRMSRKLKTICEFLNINCDEEPARVENNEALMEALQRVWDGSEKHARILASLLDSLASSNLHISHR